MHGGTARRLGVVVRIAVAALLALGLGAACQTTPAPRPDPARGETAYAKYCALCHGSYGEGYAADNANALANPEFLSVAPDAFLAAGIADGRPGTPMSAWSARWGGPLDDGTIDDIVAFLRTWQHVPSIDVSGVTASGDASRAEPVYAAQCASCHGPRGAGSSLAMSITNPYFLATASDGFLRDAIARGRSFTAMPGFDGQLSTQQIDDLVGLLRAWQTPVDSQPPPAYVPTYGDAVQNPTGPDPAFTLRDGRYVAADDAYAALTAGARIAFADARATSDYLIDHIAGAVSVPFYDADQYAAHLPADTWIVCYCACPHAASDTLADALRTAGLTKVAVLDEGYFVWRDRGYPIETP